MAYEIHYRDAYPYQAIVLLSVTFPNGTRAIGTGAVVERNDILTATHVLYSEEDGGWASDIELYFGADYNSYSDRFEDYGAIQLTQFTYKMVGWPAQVNSQAPYDLLSAEESQYDVALLGISEPVGDQVGWFGLHAGYNEGVWAQQIGYPNGSTGMMQGQAWVERIAGYHAYEAFSYDDSDIMGPGSSGGPLFIYDNDKPYIIGVKSAGSDSRSVWADIGFTYDALLDAIAENDTLISGHQPAPQPRPDPSPEPGPTPDAPNPSHPDTPYTWHYPNLTETLALHGSPGLDVVVYEATVDHFSLNFQHDQVIVQHADYPYQSHALFDMERLEFADGTMALDVGVGEIAGGVYRLYQAAFDRVPDHGGLAYWIHEMDHGLDLLNLAALFTASPEFQQMYGLDPSAEDLVERYYYNVLGRAPDATGQQYWVSELERGYSPIELLAYFTESPENVARLEPVLETGIWL